MTTKTFTVEEVRTELLKYHKVLTGWLNDKNLLFTAFPFEGNDESKKNLENFVEWLNQRQQQVKVEPEVKPEIADLTNKENENYIDHYIDMGHFADPVKARPYLLDGFYHGYNYLKKKIEKQFSV